MHPRGLDTVNGADGAGKFALERAQVIDVLDEACGAERVGFIEDLVTDAAALGQAAFRELHAQPCDLVLWHHDHGAVIADFKGNGLAFQVLDDGRGILDAEVGKEGGHLRRGDAHDDEREETDQRGSHRDHRHQPRSTQALQEAYETLQTNRPSDSAPGADWAIIAYGMVSIWLTMIKRGGECLKRKKSASQSKADFPQIRLSRRAAA